MGIFKRNPYISIMIFFGLIGLGISYLSDASTKEMIGATVAGAFLFSVPIIGVLDDDLYEIRKLARAKKKCGA